MPDTDGVGLIDEPGRDARAGTRLRHRHLNSCAPQARQKLIEIHQALTCPRHPLSRRERDVRVDASDDYVRQLPKRLDEFESVRERDTQPSEPGIDLDVDLGRAAARGAYGFGKKPVV